MSDGVKNDLQESLCDLISSDFNRLDFAFASEGVEYVESTLALSLAV